MNNEIVPANVYEVITGQEQSFNKMLSSDEVHWAKESQFAMQALQSNKYLNEVAWKNQASLQNAIINVASIGISLDPASKHAYLVPRGSKVCLDISYMGLMHLAQQTGSILWGQAKLVYATDIYENTGIDSAPAHKSNPFASNNDRGPVVGAYCTAKTADGSYLTEEMNIDELNKIKSSSKSADGPWKTWPEEMMRKSVVKRASKYWPKVERLNLAIDAINQHEGIDFHEERNQSGEKEVFAVIDEDQIVKLIQMIIATGMTEEQFCQHKKVNIPSIKVFPAARYEGCIKWLKSLSKEEDQ